MKRFSAREFALLCSPLLAVAIGGFVLSRRAPSRDDEKPRLAFHVEKPTVLEAFKGADAVCVVESNWKQHTQFWLKVQTARGQEDSRLASSSLSGEKWFVFVEGDQAWTRYGINLRKVPHGVTKFGVSWVDSSALVAAPPVVKRASGTQEWPLNRASINPFPFAQIPSEPRIVLHSVSITEVPFNMAGMVTGEAVFDVERSTVHGRDVVVSLVNQSAPVSSFISPTKSSVRRRVCSWAAFPATPKSKLLFHISGRVSADNLWPLAFQIEPFDFAKVKVGQKLKFKSWPAPVPAMSK